MLSILRRTGITTLLLFILFSCSNSSYDVSVIYPFEGSIFPAEAAVPGIRWESTDSTVQWDVTIKTQSKTLAEEKNCTSPWWPDAGLWENIKKESNNESIYAIVSSGEVSDTVSFSISEDSLGAPIFFRSVILPFSQANKYKDSLCWYLGDAAENGEPKLLMSGLPVCANCHSFSADGSKFAMDVDYANNKGSYTVSAVEKESAIKIDDIFTWDDYKKEEGDLTFGLLSQISPDGNWAVSTVKDRSVFVPIEDNFTYSQLFFPIKGILVSYNLKDKKFRPLHGADTAEYVQSSPTWSPDGKEIVFAKALRQRDSALEAQESVVISPSFAGDYIMGRKDFKFELWKVPFNEGDGGTAVPLKGASGNGKSNYFPKYSPDGRWIVYCQSDNFMLLRKSSKLYIIPAEGGEAREMNCNTDDMNSWHSWSPNGKWIVFSTKHFGPYTQLFLTHIDENGNDSPPIWLEHFTLPKRAVNIPEFVNIDYDDWDHITDAFSTTGNYYSRAIAECVDKGDKNGALHYMDLLIENDSTSAFAYIQRADFYMRNKEPDLAQADFMEALYYIDEELEKDPNSLYNLKLKVSAYAKMKRYDEAIEIFKKISRIDKDVYGTLKLKLTILLEAGKIKEALDECDRYLAKHPENTELNILKADVLFETKQYEAALAQYTYLIDKEGITDYNFLMKRMNINYILKNKEACLKDAQTMADAGIMHYMPYYLLAQAAYANHDLETAKKNIQAAKTVNESLLNTTPIAKKEQPMIQKLYEKIMQAQ